jgi:hypothetical protein
LIASTQVAIFCLIAFFLNSVKYATCSCKEG